MHDLNFFRSNFEPIAERLATRGGALNLDGFRALDAKRRSAIVQAEQLKASVRAKVEHPFRVVKQQFGHAKVRYRVSPAIAPEPA